MVIGYHLIWTLYGWWLPNDPRGSTSSFVHSDVLFELGNLHQGRKRVQPSSREIHAFYENAKGKLRFPLLSFTAKEFLIVAAGFERAIREHRYICYGCAVMPDHVHVLIRKHKDLAEEMMENLRSASRDHLISQGVRHPDHPVWGGPGWKVFLDTPDDIWRTRKYIEDNPLPFRLPKQRWSFVSEYDNWPQRKPKT